MKTNRLTAEEVAEAREWWKRLPDSDKGGLSIYILLAMYAHDWAEKNIRFSHVSKGEHAHVLDREREKA